MVEVHLYGQLRRHAPDSRASGESVVQLTPQPGETVRTALAQLDISPDDVCHVFLNGAILTTRNTMAPWLRYQQASDRTDAAEGLDTPIQDGDRLGLFAHDMALLVV